MTDLVVAHITQNKILILKELFMMSDKALFAIAFKVIGPSREVANVEFATMSDFANRFDITVSKTMQLEEGWKEMGMGNGHLGMRKGSDDWISNGSGQEIETANGFCTLMLLNIPDSSLEIFVRRSK